MEYKYIDNKGNFTDEIPSFYSVFFWDGDCIGVNQYEIEGVLNAMIKSVLFVTSGAIVRGKDIKRIVIDKDAFFEWYTDVCRDKDGFYFHKESSTSVLFERVSHLSKHIHENRMNVSIRKINSGSQHLSDKKKLLT